MGSEALAAGRRALNARRQAEALARKSDAKSKAAARKARKAATTAEYRRRLAITKQYGIYAPSSVALTPYRRAAINRRYRKLEELLSGSAFAEYPKASAARKAGFKGSAKTARKQIRKGAKSVGGTVTRKGVFAPRGHERATKATKGRLHYDKTTGLWEMVIRRDVTFTDKKTRKKEHRVKFSVRPLAGSTALIAKEEQVRQRWEGLGPLRKNERLRFVIEGRNISKSIFRSMDTLLDYARKYRKTPQQQTEFLNSLEIQVVERYNVKKKRAKYDAEPVKRFRPRLLRSHVDPEILDQFEEEEDAREEAEK